MIAAFKFRAYPDAAAQVLLHNAMAELNDLGNACLQQRTEAYGARTGAPWIAWSEEARAEGGKKRYGGPRLRRRGGIIVSHAEPVDAPCECGSGKKWRECHGAAEVAAAEAAWRAAYGGDPPAHMLSDVRERRLSLQRQVGKSMCTDCGAWCAVVGRSACCGADLLVPGKAEEISDDFIGPPALGQIRRAACQRLMAAGEGAKKVCAACLEPVGRQIDYLSACHEVKVQQYPGQSEDLTLLREANADTEADLLTEIDRLQLQINESPGPVLEGRLALAHQQLAELRRGDRGPALSTMVRRPGKGKRPARIRHDEVPRAAQTDALERLEKGYQNAFKRIARGEKAGFPKYKKRRDARSIGIQWDHGVCIEGRCPACSRIVGTPDARRLDVHSREPGKRPDDRCTYCSKARAEHNEAQACPAGRKQKTGGYSSYHDTQRYTAARCPGSEGPLRDPGSALLVIAWGRGNDQRRIEVPLQIHISKPLAAAARQVQEAERSVGRHGAFRRAVEAALKAQPELGGIQGTPKHCVLIEEPDGRWFAVIQCDDVEPLFAVATDREVGIDLGWSDEVLAVLSDGTEIPHPAFGELALPRLEAAQRGLSRKLRPSLSSKHVVPVSYQRGCHVRSAGQMLAEAQGLSWAQMSKKARRALLTQAVHGKRVPRSKRAEVARHQLAVVQGQVRRQRGDFSHKVSHGLVYGGRVSAVAGVRPFSLDPTGRIAVEKLSIRQMAEEAHKDPDIADPATLNRRNADSGWGGLVTQIKSKGGAAGRLVIEVPAERDQKRGGRADSAKRILEAGRATWSPSDQPIQTPGTPSATRAAHAVPGAGAGPVPETRATKRRPRGAGGGTGAPTRNT